MSNPRVVLYGPNGAFEGVSSVLVAPNGTPVAAVTPWPAELYPTTAFAVQVLAGSGAQEWHTPQDVDVIRLKGAPVGSSVGVIVLTQRSALALTPLPHVSRQLVIDTLKVKGVRGTLVHLGAGCFSELNPPPVAPPVSAAPPQTAVPQNYITTLGAADVIALSICRIFHWD
jgi:hypothetical protein